MEEIFRRLSENVSEQCYDEIMGLVEDVLSQIKKVHGEPEWDEETGKPKNRSAELTDKAEPNVDKERLKVGTITKYTPKIIKKAHDASVIFEPSKNQTKNEAGEEFNDERRKGFPTKKSLGKLQLK